MPGGGGGGRPSLWATPTPYLLLGLSVVIMGVIVVALLVLICTRRDPASSSSSRQLVQEADDGEKAASVRGVLVPLDREAPRVVVIMAGDAVPSFLASAKPLTVDTCSGAAEAV
jgi:hypothetical protein